MSVKRTCEWRKKCELQASAESLRANAKVQPTPLPLRGLSCVSTAARPLGFAGIIRVELSPSCGRPSVHGAALLQSSSCPHEISQLPRRFDLLGAVTCAVPLHLVCRVVHGFLSRVSG